MPFTSKWISNPMNVIMRAVILSVVLIGIAGPAVPAFAQPPREQQTEYVPLKDLPPTEEFPAARLLVGAYVFVPIVLFLYLFSVARKTSVVQREIERLERDLKRTARG